MATTSEAYKISFSPDVGAFKGLGRSMAADVTSEFDSGTSGFGDKLGKVLGGLGKAAAVGFAAAGAGVLAMGGSALKAQADIQQSMGGSEAVFKDFASDVQQWAAAAAGTMGMSVNDALETANKMGSLYQGSGIEAGKAAEMTMTMSQRAADVASVMGVDLAAAMDAVAGAAKGNFTMMDNLGVAMNDTTLKAYAAEKGYEKLWTEMSNAEKNTVAYEMFMERTADYAGNFARENTSLAGSMDILKSSWNNVMQSLADPAMLKTSMAQLSTALTGAFSAVQAVLPAIIEGMGTLIRDGMPVILNIIGQLIPELTNLIKTTLPGLITSIADALPGLIESLLTSIIDMAPMLLDTIVGVVLIVVGMLPALITQLTSAIVQLLPMIMTAATELFMGIVEALPAIIDALAVAMPVLIQAIFDALFAAAPQLEEASKTLWASLIPMLVNSIGPMLAAILEMLPTIIVELGKQIANSYGVIIEILFPLIGQIIRGIADMFTSNGGPALFETALLLFSNFLNGMFAFVGTIYTAVTGFVSNIITNIRAWFGETYNSGNGLATNLVLGITNILVNLWENMRQFIADIPANISAAWSGAMDLGANLVQGIWNGIIGAKDWLINQIKGFGDAVMTGFRDIFDINSPSVLMEQEVGMYIGQGVGSGIRKSIGDVLKDAEAFSSQVAGGFDIRPEVDYGTEGAFAGAGAAPIINVNQSFDKPQNMMDVFLTTKRGANAGLTLA